MELHGSTESVCPVDAERGDWRKIEAKLWVDSSSNEVWMTKHCDRHGEFQDLISTDAGDYLRAERFSQKGTGVTNPISYTDGECPTRCGICFDHESKTVLAIIDVTNRCNMRCPVCFANAGAAGYVYEPTLDQIDRMLEAATKVNLPKGIHALQLSGGEPTVRDDLPDIVKLVKKHGINAHRSEHQRLEGRRPGYRRRVPPHPDGFGVSTLYLQFDGLTPSPRLVARVPGTDDQGRSMSDEGKAKLARFYLSASSVSPTTRERPGSRASSSWSPYRRD